MTLDAFQSSSHPKLNLNLAQIWSYVWHLWGSAWLTEDAHTLGYTNNRSAPCLCFNTLYFLWYYRLFKPTSYPLNFSGKRKYHLFLKLQGKFLFFFSFFLSCITLYFCTEQTPIQGGFLSCRNVQSLQLVLMENHLNLALPIYIYYLVWLHKMLLPQ